MRKHRSYPIEFKRQVAQEYLAGETLHGLAKRHEINRNLVRIWVAKYEAGYTIKRMLKETTYCAIGPPAASERRGLSSDDRSRPPASLDPSLSTTCANSHWPPASRTRTSMI